MRVWLLMSILAAILWAFVVLMDKFIIDRTVEDPMIDSGVHGLMNSAVVFIVSVFIAGITVSIELLIAGLLLGGLYISATFVWFSGAKKEDISRFAPVLSADVIFIVLLSFLLLGKSYDVLTYAGISLTVLGAFVISIEDPVHSLKQIESWKALSAALTAASLYGVREVFFKFFSSSWSVWNILVYVGGIGSIFSIIMLAYKFNRVGKTSREGLELLGASGIMSGSALIVFFFAVSIGPVSLVSTVTKTRFIGIFFGATAISRLHPEIIHEKVDKTIVIQKFIAIIMLILGVTIIIL